jgi:hypothetical protein
MVIAILGIMLTIGAMTMRFLIPETRLEATARDLASTIEDARSQAILAGRVIRIEYELGESNTAAQRYRSIRDPEPGDENEFEEQEDYLTLVDWRNVPMGVRISGILVGEEDTILDGFYSLAAYPDGSIASHVVQVYCEEVESYFSIEVHGLLGETQLKEGQVEPIYLTEDSF